MKNKEIMDVYPARPSYITITIFGKVDIELPKHQKVRKVAKVWQEILLKNDETLLYTHDAQVNTGRGMSNDIHYKPTMKCPGQMAKPEAVA